LPGSHSDRAWGKSQFVNVRRLGSNGIQLVQWWWKLVVKKEHLRKQQPRPAPFPLPEEVAERAEQP